MGETNFSIQRAKFFQYKKNEGLKLSNCFNSNEFQCKCDKEHDNIIHVMLVSKLIELRRELSMPIYINSGYRCPEHNKAVGGVSNSMHVEGRAADITVTDFEHWKPVLLKLIDRIGFNGVGIYDTFIHVDTRIEKARWNG